MWVTSYELDIIPNQLLKIGWRPKKSIKFTEDSSRTIHELGNIELHELGQRSRTVQCQSCLKHIPEGLIFCSCAICLRLDEEQMERIKARFEAVMVPHCLARVNYPRGKRHGEAPWQKDHCKARDAQRGKKGMVTFPSCSDGRMTKCIENHKRSWMDRRVFPIPGLPHDDRPLPQRNLAPAELVRKQHLTGVQWWW